MCDQTEVTYGDGDVVWAKIGPIWWPGVVRDVEKYEEEKQKFSGLKSSVIAIVKFFDEDKYEFIKNLEHIYHYNCRKKEEFIRKGLDKYRTGAQHMSKFPSDIAKAEELVNGDPNIVNDPKFAPAAKPDYSAIFSSSKKKLKKDDNKLKVQKMWLLAGSRRNKFACKSGDGRLERPRLKEQQGGPLIQEGFIYNCPFCVFTSTVVSNIAAHVTRIHTKGRVDFAPAGYVSHSSVRKYTDTRRPKTKTSIVGKKKTKPTKSNETEGKEKEQSRNAQKSFVKKTGSGTVEKEKKKRFTDALLADWSEDDDLKGDNEIVDEEEDEGEDVNDVTEKADLEEVNSSPDKQESPLPPVVENPPIAVLAPPSTGKKESASCFDFDDEDDGFIGMSNANTYGRKIPRVIPVKDKTDLGLDLEMDEIFKRKPDSDDGGEAVVEAEVVEVKPKRRGRRRKSEIEAEARKSFSDGESSPKKIALPVLKTLAATRDRRPGARKSYLKEVIEKIDDNGRIIRSDPEDDTPSKPPSRRKQDLKRVSLVELDELDLEKKKKENKIKEVEEGDDFDSKFESLMAETAAPSIPYVPKVQSDIQGDTVLTAASGEEDVGAVEYLEEECVKAQPEKMTIEESPKSVWKDSEGVLQASVTAQWKQDIRNALQANKEGQTKEVIVGTAASSEPRTKVLTLKGQKILQQKGSGTYFIVKPQAIGNRPKILGKSPGQQLMVVSNPSTQKGSGGIFPNQQRVKVVSPVKSSNSQPLVISDGTRGIKTLSLPKKLIQLKNYSKKIVLTGKSCLRDGLRVIENYNDTGRTVIIKENSSSTVNPSGQVVSGQTVIGVRKKAQGEHGSEPSQCIIERVKGPEGKYRIQKIVKGVRIGPDGTYVLPQKQQRSQVIQRQDVSLKPETIRVVSKPPEIVEPVVLQTPIVEEEPIEQPAPVISPQQVVAMPGPVGPDGQPTYVLLTMDENGVMQAVDSSVIAYDTQGQLVQQDSGVLMVNPAEDITTPSVYSTTSQDILAEALANTNVLADSEPTIPTLIIPSVIPDHSSHSPILTSLGVPPSVIPDPSGLVISPVVQETSVTLAKPIMTPIEVPTSIVPDTSGLEPPPLPPTPTDEDVMMEEQEGGLMIAEQPGEEIPGHEEQVEEAEETNETTEGEFFIDDSQGDEANSFQSMPLLNEESTASEEPIGDQNFEAQSARLEKNSEFLPTSTKPDLEEPVEDADNTQEEVKEGADMPFITEEEGFSVEVETHRPQETEISSTTGDSKDSVS